MQQRGQTHLAEFILDRLDRKLPLSHINYTYTDHTLTICSLQTLPGIHYKILGHSTTLYDKTIYDYILLGLVKDIYDLQTNDTKSTFYSSGAASTGGATFTSSCSLIFLSAADKSYSGLAFGGS